MIIDLPPHIEQVIIAKAQAEQISVEDLITKWAKQETAVNPMIARALPNPNPSVLGNGVELQREWCNDGTMLVTDFFKQLPPNPAFENIDPVEYQREMRNEWD